MLKSSTIVWCVASISHYGETDYPWECWNEFLGTWCPSWRQPARIRKRRWNLATSSAEVEFRLRTVSYAAAICSLLIVIIVVIIIIIYSMLRPNTKSLQIFLNIAHSGCRSGHFMSSLKWSLVIDTPQVFDFLKVDSDMALLPSWFNFTNSPTYRMSCQAMSCKIVMPRHIMQDCHAKPCHAMALLIPKFLSSINHIIPCTFRQAA